MLSSADIRQALATGLLNIADFDRECLRPSSYLLRLAPVILVARGGGETVDTRQTDCAPLFERIVASEDGVVLQPGQLYLCSSIERVTLSSEISGMLSLLSCYARTGLGCNLSSNLVAATFGATEPGCITFEVINLARRPIRVYPGVKFCHITFFRHVVPSDLAYTGIYSSSNEARPSNFQRRPAR